MKRCSIYLAVAVMTSVSVAQAQNRSPAGKQRCGGPVPYAGRVYVCSPCIAGHVHHSSTVAESYGRRMAAMVQAQAYYNLLTSQARINAAEAQRLQMENKRKRVETYYALQEAYKERRDAKYAARRHRIEDVARSQDGQPEQSAAADLPTVAIQWPTILEGPKYVHYRKLVERVAAKRAAGIEPTAAEQSRLTQANRVVLSTLKNAAEDFSATDRDAARQFVQSLAAGGRAEMARLAANK